MAFSLTFGATLTNNPTTCPKPSGLAVGDLMICQLVMVDGGAGDVATWVAGWTLINKTRKISLYSELRYKFADAADVAASNISVISGFTLGGTSEAHLIRVAGASELGIVGNAADISNSATPSYAISVTPGAKNEDSLLMFFVAADNAGPSAISAYAIATSDPGGWTELYDETNNKVASLGYVTRPQITATGNGSCAISGGGNSVGQMVVVRPARIITVLDTESTSEILTMLRTRLFSVLDTQSMTESLTTEVKRRIRNAVKHTAAWINRNKS